MYRE